jgi:hypothetical protein
MDQGASPLRRLCPTASLAIMAETMILGPRGIASFHLGAEDLQTSLSSPNT